jgi:hypothetical protein
MSYWIDTIRAQIIDKLDNRVKITYASLYDEGNQTQVIQLCDDKWLSLYNSFVGGITVDSFINGFYTIRTDEPVEVGQILQLPIPVFFHGTPYSTIEEWHKFSSNERDKLPFIWLVTPAKNHEHGAERNAWESLIDCEFFIVHYSDWTETNSVRTNESIKPLHEVVKYLTKCVNSNSKYFDKHTGFKTKDFPKFGQESRNGVESVLMNSTLGAVKLDIKLRFLKNYDCKPCAGGAGGGVNVDIFDETFDETFE